MKSAFVTAHGIKTRYQTFGRGAEIMIFLHGWGGSAESFESLAPRIAKQNKIKAVIVDLPGFGESGLPPKQGWDTHEYELWLEEFLQKLNIAKAHFYGHSFGCRVIVRLLLKQPHLAQKVILTGAAGIKWPPTLREKVSLFLSTKFVQSKKLIPASVQQFLVCRVFGARDWGMVSEELKSTLKKVLEEKDFRDDLPKIKNLVLLLWGAQDKITPLRSGKVFAEKLPRAQLKILPTGRHGIHRTHANEIVKSITKFLRNT